MRFTRRSKWLLCSLLALVLWITPVAALASEQTAPAEQSVPQESEPNEETDAAAQPADAGTDGESGMTDPSDAVQGEGNDPASGDDQSTEETPSEDSSSEDSSSEEGISADETPEPSPTPEAVLEPAETPVPTDTPESALLAEMDTLTDAKLTDGIYTIYTGVSDTRVLDIKAASQVNGGQAQIYTDNDSMAQQFFVRSLGSGLYSLENMSSGLMLDVSGGKKVNGTKIQQYAGNGSKAQKWYILNSARSGYCVIASALDKTMVLDVTDGLDANKTKVQLYKADSSTKQQWKFRLRNPAVTITDGAYTIASAADSTKVLDVKSGSKENGVNVRIYTSNGTNAQKFWFESIGEGWYEITNIGSGRALDVEDASRTEGTNVRQYTPDHSAGQKWRIFEGADSTYLLYSGVGGRVLVVNDGTANGTNVQIGVYTRSKYHRFTLKKTTGSKTLVSQVSPEEIKADGLYTIRSLVGGLTVLDVANASLASSANVQIYQSNDTNAQKWYLVKHGDWYQIISGLSGKALDVKGGKAVDGANVQQYNNNYSVAQDWKLVPTGNSDGSVYIESRLGKNLDVKDGIPSNKTNVQINAKKNTKAQKFLLIPTTLADGWAVEENGTRIYLINGKKATGWNKIGSYNYYFKSDGSLAVNTVIDGYKIGADGRRTGIRISTRPKTLYHTPTVLNLLKNALVPCGRVLYVWAGGHEDIISSGYAGYPSFWDDFYLAHATEDYNRHDFEWKTKAGLDCSGYAGWVVYNTLHSKSKLEYLGYSTSEIKSAYLNKGYANPDYITYKAATTTAMPGKVYPGDLCVMAGHVMICLGQCSDRSAVFLHSAPSDGDGGGVQISGTKKPVKNSEGKIEWKSDSQAAALARKYMSKYFPEWPFGTRAALGSEYMKFAYGRVHWNSSVLSDPEGVVNMSADQVLKLLLGSV